MAREMKDSGIEWVGKIPVHWNIRKGKYLFTQVSTKGNTKKLQLLSPTQNYGVIPQSLYEELSGMSAVKLNERVDLNELKTVHVGAFCISLRSFQGGFEYSNYEGVVSNAYQIFYKSSDKIVDNYYRYLFKEPSFIEKINSYTMSLRDGKNIAFSDFGNTLIPLPPFSEQNAIANFLDSKCSEIDSLIDDITKEIELLKEYRKSVIYEAVTKGLDPNVEMKDSGIAWIGKIPVHWKISKVKRLHDIVLGKMVDTKTQEDLSPYLCAANIKWEGVNTSIERKMYFSLIEKKEYLLKKDDVLIMEGGATAGTTCMYNNEFSPCYIQNSVMRCRSDSYFSSKFLYYWMSVVNDEGYINVICNKATMPHFTKEKVQATPIVLLPSKEQMEIIGHLDSKCSEIDSIIASKQEQIETLKEYKKSLIYEYVTGKKEVPAV